MTAQAPPPVAPPAHAAPARPRVWTVFVAFSGALLLIIVASAMLVAALVVQHGGSLAAFTNAAALERVLMSPVGLIGGIVISSGLLGLTAAAGARFSPKPWRERLAIPAGVRPAALEILVASLGCVALGEAMSSMAALAGLGDDSSLTLIAKAARSLSPAGLIALVVVGSVGPGICEELFFRGYLQTRLVKRWGPWVGIAVTATLFGLLHLDPLHAPIAAVLGLYFGWLAHTRGTILLGIIVHALNNATSFLLTGLLPADAIEGHEGAFLGGSLVVATAAIAWLARRAGSVPIGAT